ncbi:MAG: hypothetical protein DHS20C16_23640 [Phycisphaerae bacterium]|nr:MAG: hypothetical protein DHS20C16_23640 [Phycisphaerae bacterium]
MWGRRVIRKAVNWCFILLSTATLVLALLSFVIDSQLECFDLANLTPQPDIIENFETGESRFVEREEMVEYLPGTFIVKDAGFADWLNIDRKGEVPPMMRGLLLYKHDYGGGTRAYVGAADGSLFLSYFELWLRGSRAIRTGDDYFFFSIENDWTGLIKGLADPYWRSQIASLSQEELKSAREENATVWVLRIPLWVPFLLFISIPTGLMVVGVLRRHRRRKDNQCIHCGYNLTGLPEPRCPECGMQS